MIVDYCVIEASDTDELTRIIKENIDDGWQPLGGIAVVQYMIQSPQQHWWYTQAMVKYSEV